MGSDKVKMIFPSFKYNINDIIGDLKIIECFVEPYTHKSPESVAEITTQRNKYYFCECRKCGYIFKRKETDIKRTSACPCCNGRILVVGKNDLFTTNPELLPFFQGGKFEMQQYQHGTHKKIYPVCPCCGRLSPITVSINNLCKRKSIYCECNAGISYGEKFIWVLLESLGISFVYQANKTSLPWVKNAWRYDFYLPDNKLIIEIHGAQHYYTDNKKIWGKDASSIKINDEAKKILALSNNIKYIEIDVSDSSLEYIKSSIQNSELLNFIDISTVDYLLIEKEVREKSLCVEIGKYYMEHDHPPTKILCDEFGLSNTTIVKYLKRCQQMGFVDKIIHKKTTFYSSDRRKEISQLFVKQTYMFDLQGNLIKTFDSRLSAAEYLIKQLKLNNIPKRLASTIGKACNPTDDRIKTIHGFQFRDEPICTPYIKKKTSKPIICINNNMYFDSIRDAIKWCGMDEKQAPCFTKALKNSERACGKHPETLEPLYWKYADMRKVV